MAPASAEGNKKKKIQPFREKGKVPPRAVGDAGPGRKK